MLQPLEVYLLVSYNSKRWKVKYYRRISKERYKSLVSGLVLSKPQPWINDRLLKYCNGNNGAMKNKSTISFINLNKEIVSVDYEHQKIRIEAKLSFEPCVFKYWRGRLFVFNELKGFKIYGDWYGGGNGRELVYESFKEGMSYANQVKIQNTYLEGRFSNCGRNAMIKRGMLIFLNYDSNLSVLYGHAVEELIQTGKEAFLGIVKMNQDKIEHFAGNQFGIYLLSISGEVEVRKFVVRGGNLAVDVKASGEICLRRKEASEQFHTIACSRRTGLVGSSLLLPKKIQQNRLSLFGLKEPRFLSELVLPKETSPIHIIKPFIRRRIEYYIVANARDVVRLVSVYKKDMILLHSYEKACEGTNKHINSIIISRKNRFWIAHSGGVKLGLISYDL